ncbi:MAG: tetratricopeptide repeat protein [Chitinophagaceae bacterium]|nr:tetratricopeptide repeat protein [Chitinophagaceae bacterium]
MKKLFTLILTIFACTAISAQNADSARFYFQKGLVEKKDRRYLVASGHFNKAIEFDPAYVEAYIESGFVNKEMRKTDASKADFAKAVELDPNNVVALTELMDLYYNYRQYQQVIDVAAKCKTCVNKEKIIAMSYFQMEDYGRAEKLLITLLNKNPNDAELTYTLARNYLEMGLEAKAIPWYEKAVQLDEKNAKWHFELGLLYANNNRYKHAVIAYNKAADKGFTKGNDFKENLGFAYLYSGDFANGELLLNEIIARKPGDTELLRDVATAFFDSKSYDKALDYCQRLLEINFKDGKALYQAGLCFQKKGQVERGMQMCDKAIELDPSLAGLKNKKLSPGM